MTSYQPSELLDRLVHQLIDETIDASGIEQLDRIFQQDPYARRWYLEEVRMHSALHRWASNLEKETPSVDKIIQCQRKRNLRIALVSAAAVLLLAVVTMRLFFIEEKQPTLTFEIAPGTQFVLTHSHQREISDQAMVLEEGSRLQLSQGTVELRFSSGVRSVVMGPADVTLQDEGTLYMRQGTAWFHVPQKAVGFQVKTEDFDVVDLGTKFGVLAKLDDHDEVHVFQGKVQVTAKRLRKESATLVAKDARRVDPVGRLESIASRSSFFLTSLPQTLPYLHWSFNQVVDGVFPVKGSFAGIDLASAVPRDVEGDVLVVSGKYGKAVAIDQYQQELLTQHLGISGNKPRTVACWIKVNGSPDGPNNRHSIVGWGDRAMDMVTSNRWQLAVVGDGNKRSVLCIVGAGLHRGTTPLDDGQWHHIACTWSPSKNPKKAGVLTAYIDGKREYLTCNSPSKSLSTYTGEGASPIVIGATMHLQKSGFATFEGSIDELFVIEAALTQQDIVRLMETNLMERK